MLIILIDDRSARYSIRVKARVRARDMMVKARATTGRVRAKERAKEPCPFNLVLVPTIWWTP